MKEVAQKDKEEYPCMICGEPLGYVPQMCCDGFMCGCMGQPIDPPVCSEKCYNIMRRAE